MAARQATARYNLPHILKAGLRAAASGGRPRAGKNNTRPGWLPGCRLPLEVEWTLGSRVVSIYHLYRAWTFALSL
jgi:hypothetical protein